MIKLRTQRDLRLCWAACLFGGPPDLFQANVIALNKCSVHCYGGGKSISEAIINEGIKFESVRVIDANGAQLGVMSSQEALQKAEEDELDLILIAPTANPPVCRIMDYSKFKYEQVRREKDQKKKQKTVEVKEIRFSPNIDTNDLNTKSNNARKFLEKGNRVKVTLRFRGRELAHINETKGVLMEFAETLQDIANVDKEPKMEGRSMSIVLAPKAGK